MPEKPQFMCGQMTINTLDLFSGIGGFAYGLEQASRTFHTVAFCEQDPYCQAVLRHHWPDTPIHEDVKTLSTDRLGRIDFVCGGFPCTPWSNSGKQRGAEDDRDLWPEMARIVGELRPRWVLAENVRGFINKPMGLPRTLHDLESFGYEVISFVIPACAVGSPQKRDRIWILAHASGTRGTVRLSGQESWEKGDAEKFDNGSNRQVGRSEANHWSFEPKVGRLADGLPNRVPQLRALGNSVVPQIITEFGKQILEAEKMT